jgi:hypothetical protein
MSLGYVTFGMMCGLTAGLFALGAGVDVLAAIVIYGGAGAFGLLGFSLPMTAFDWTKRR